jgi:hypothetical protein
MRWQPETAITRRDNLLARTRGLSLLIAGTATAASVGLATVLGLSIPGKAATTTSPQSPAGSHRAPAPGAPGQHHSRPGKHHSQPGRHRHLAPPAQPPSKSTAPPVTSSGGS